MHQCAGCILQQNQPATHHDNSYDTAHTQSRLADSCPGANRMPHVLLAKPSPVRIPTRRLADTGQGANRIQSAPGLSAAMHAILGRCKAAVDGWVGSSVVHLGDHNVPNAFMFIDK